jgi:hypothetical protein
MILLFYYWLHVKRVNCYVYYDLFCYTGCCVYFRAIFMLKMKQKLRLRTTTGSLPTACKQRIIPDICYGLWLIMIDTKIFWFQMISTISWHIKGIWSTTIVIFSNPKLLSFSVLTLIKWRLNTELLANTLLNVVFSI